MRCVCGFRPGRVLIVALAYTSVLVFRPGSSSIWRYINQTRRTPVCPNSIPFACKVPIASSITTPPPATEIAYHLTARAKEMPRPVLNQRVYHKEKRTIGIAMAQAPEVENFTAALVFVPVVCDVPVVSPLPVPVRVVVVVD